MAKMTVKVIGIKELQKAIQEKRNEIYAALDEAAKEAADIVRDDAKSRAAVLTGEMRDSIVTAVRFQNDGAVSYNAEIDGQKAPELRKKISNPREGGRKDSFYPAIIELGTSRVPAQPYMRPALYENKNAIKRIFSSKIKAVIDR